MILQRTACRNRQQSKILKKLIINTKKSPLKINGISLCFTEKISYSLLSNLPIHYHLILFLAMFLKKGTRNFKLL